jgi:hypothetical protein
MTQNGPAPTSNAFILCSAARSVGAADGTGISTEKMTLAVWTPIRTSRSSDRVPESGRAGPWRYLEARALQESRKPVPSPGLAICAVAIDEDAN